MVKKEYWLIFDIIVGLRETSTFENEYHLINDISIAERFSEIISQNTFSVRPTFKKSQNISDLIRGNISSFIERINKTIYEKTMHKGSLEIGWSELLEECFSAFTNDEDRIFNLELLLGKVDFNTVAFKELKNMLIDLIVQLEKYRLKKQSDLFDSDEDLLINKINVIRQFHQQTENKNSLLEEITIEYNQIIRENPVLDILEIYLFKHFIKVLKDILPWTNVGFDADENLTLVEVKKIYDNATQGENEYASFIKLELPSKEYEKDENKIIRKKTSEVIRSFYANSKQIKQNCLFVSPLIEKMDVWLPYNDNFEQHQLNYKFIDTIGLDHGENITSNKISARTLNYINKYMPDIVFLNVNLTEKQDQLQYVIDSIKCSGYLDKTFILAGHADEVALEIIKKEYLEDFIEDLDVDKLELSEKSIRMIDYANQDVSSIINSLDKLEQDKILAAILIPNLEQVLESIKDNYVINQIKASMKINFKEISRRVFLIDKLDNLTGMLGTCKLSLRSVQADLFAEVENVVKINSKKIAINMNNVDINITMDNLHKIANGLLDEFLQYEKNLYSKDNNDLRWNTVERGLYELKNNRPGQYSGTSYDITPGYDFASIFNRGIIANNEENTIFQLKFNNIEAEDAISLGNKFDSVARISASFSVNGDGQRVRTSAN